MARGEATAHVEETTRQSRYAEPYRDEENDADISSPGTPGQPSSDFDSEQSDTRPPWYRRASSHVPSKFKRAWRATVKWVKGPIPPRHFTIKPLLPKVQLAPQHLLNRIAPKRSQKVIALLIFYAFWLLCFGLVQWSSNTAASVPGYGAPVLLSCTSSYWNDGNGCGLNGDLCRPFTNATLAFRCPANCASVQVLNPHAVGDQDIDYRSLTIGGPTTEQTGYEGVIESNAVYRGDSFICGAAVHSGFISDSTGGCGVVTLTGQQQSFVASNANGIQSIGFDSYFPLSFGFRTGTRTECKDLRYPALIVSLLFSIVLSMFTSNPAVFFWSVFVGLFFTVGLATDPPYADTFYGLLSTEVGRFLPGAFCIGIMYRFFIKRSLTDLTAHIEKTVLWLGAAWVGALSNYTFDAIPIQRLTPHDIQAQPGAITALIIIVLVLVMIALGQAWAFRVEGRMPRYLGLYGLIVLCLLVLLALPGVNLRIHHYILGLLFIPGTSFQNRPSLLYQGLLVGLFINGIARWGFDSIIQTPAQLFSGAQQDSLLPTISVLAAGIKNITFNLGALPLYDANLDLLYDGISILVNDVERFVGYYDESEYWNNSTGGNYTWSWTKHAHQTDAVVTSNVSFPEYFRFAYLAGSSVADFTMAGKWNANGNWTQMEAGPSKRDLAQSVHQIPR
ncbi:hypothetical protein AMS68_008028 [Peltaster fructicola]|uniref:LCCL domain-containing protein n=1 Tax=Peltaster fructicola TaxID=286661 RepID=A0A6H0Y6P0_9PEZI|nr:hypothetical protein AMS68_008028 [Peltaster fructicola]